MIAWCRRHLGIVITCVATIAAPFLFYFWSQEIEIQDLTSSEPVEAQNGPSSDESSLPSVTISWIHVSKVAMDISAAFEAEITVTGRRNATAARDLRVILDFGRAEVDICDYMPRSAITTIVDEDKSYRRLEISKLRKKDSLHIRCLISTPEFNQVIVEGNNIFRGDSINYRQYQDSLMIRPAKPLIKTLINLFIIFLFILAVLTIGRIVFLWLGRMGE